jgi:integrase
MLVDVAAEQRLVGDQCPGAVRSDACARRGPMRRGLSAANGYSATRRCARVTTPHTLPHTFVSVAGDLGFSELTIAALLGHV